MKTYLWLCGAHWIVFCSTFHGLWPAGEHRAVEASNTRPDSRETGDGTEHYGPDAAMSSFIQRTYQPRKRHLDERRLRRRLGDDFDPLWMSVTKPRRIFERNKATTRHALSARHQRAWLNLNFTFVNEHNQQMTLSAAERRNVERYLRQRVTCPVYYTWTDLGASFWPRWIRHGWCRSKKSCSWPPGMHCVPAKTVKLRLLYWQCHKPRIRSRQTHRADENVSPTSSDADEQRVTPGGQSASGLRIELGLQQNRRHRKNTANVLTNDVLQSRTGAKTSRAGGLRCKFVKTNYRVISACACSC